MSIPKFLIKLLSPHEHEQFPQPYYVHSQTCTKTQTSLVCQLWREQLSCFSKIIDISQEFMFSDSEIDDFYDRHQMLKPGGGKKAKKRRHR